MRQGDNHGKATFTDLKITGAGTYKIKFTSGSLTEILSILITISPT